MTSAVLQFASAKPQEATAQMMSDRPDNDSSSQVDSGGFFSASEPSHDPVMVNEILADLNLHPGSTVVDGTLGLGGHSKRFVEVIKPGGTLIGFDWDEANRDKNWLKHQVTWQECEEIFFNYPVYVQPDEPHSQKEERFFASGKTNSSRLLLAFLPNVTRHYG